MNKDELIRLNHKHRKEIAELKVKLKRARAVITAAGIKIENTTGAYMVSRKDKVTRIPPDKMKRRFRAIRKTMKLTQIQMASICGISPWYVSHIETGPTPCNPRSRTMSSTLMMLAEERLKEYNKKQKNLLRMSKKGRLSIPIPDDPELRLKIISLYFGSKSMSISDIAKKLAIRDEVVLYHIDSVK